MPVSALMDRISGDLKRAMKERQQREVAVLRMVKAEGQKFQADQGTAYQVTDGDVQGLIRRLIKQRREAAAQYSQGGAAERAQEELEEVKILEAYLPEQLSPQAVEELIASVIADLGASSPRDMGKVMGAVMPKLQGQADGNFVRETVQRLLRG